MHFLVMTLNEYMRQHKLRDADMAESLAMDRSNISRLRRGLILPSARVLSRISTATKGAVTPNDFYNVPVKGGGIEAT
jgi:transcriptional regulator with XRE-family HTH domain